MRFEGCRKKERCAAGEVSDIGGGGGRKNEEAEMSCVRGGVRHSGTKPALGHGRLGGGTSKYCGTFLLK